MEERAMQAIKQLTKEKGVPEEQIVSDQNRVMAALKNLRVRYVTINSPDQAHQLTNVNTPQDYENLKRQPE